MKEIMTRAWELRRANAEMTMSAALRLAWFEHKNGIKKAYAYHMTAFRRAMIEAYVCSLGCAILSGEVDDVHQIHKYNIIGQALQLSDKDELVITDGKTVGLLKYAVRNAA